jgi:hypothetical protein
MRNPERRMKTPMFDSIDTRDSRDVLKTLHPLSTSCNYWDHATGTWEQETSPGTWQQVTADQAMPVARMTAVWGG